MNDERGFNKKYNNWNSQSRGSYRGGGGRGNKRGAWRGGRSNYRGSQSHGNYGNRGDQSFRGQNRQQNNYKNQNQQWQNRPKRDRPGKRLTEEEIGVTEYVTDHEGFLGIIKSRYSDFQVSEINEQGEVAKLTNLSPPEPPEEKEVVEDEDLLLCKYNLELLPMDTWDRINKMAVCADASSDVVEVDVTGMTKEQRTKIHDGVKKAFGKCIVGSTVTEGDKKLVRFVKFKKGVRIDNRVKWVWPAEYTYFIVHKENCDTMDAASRIAEKCKLNIRPSMLGYAGTKDRRAKTSQWFSLRKVDPRKIAGACRGMRDVRVGNFTFRPNNLKLGMLRGNQFRIALRNVTAEDDYVTTACQYLKNKGFINYYGLQRFGSRVDIPTCQVGLKLLQGNLKEAIDCILSEREGPLQGALRAYREEGAGAALRAWPRRAPHASIELRLLRALRARPHDLLGALDKLARNTRLLYLHSYQSLVWNRAVSERIRRFGLQPAIGDLVPLDVRIEEEIEVPSDLEDEEEDSDFEGNDDKSENGGDDKMADKEQTLPYDLETSIKQVKQKVPTKVLTQEDIDGGKYSIFDIILPLPGHMIEYPPNMKQFYLETLEKDGLNMEMKHKFKSYTMSGAYRHMVVRPVDVSWRCVRYSDPYADLIRSDVDELEGKELHGIIDHGKYRALILNMTLPSSCYATMALRELLKIDTSSDNQALQNNYHKKKEADQTEKTGESESEKINESEMAEETNTEKESDETETSNKDGDITEVDDGVKAVIKTETGDNQAEKRKLESAGDEVEVKKLKQEVELE
ncbi:pseudouridylate synthase 7 homolog [Pectinophora gossypiella]|uniref:pseudouridylate synthase 7 homolog n=1 Tax=Pectinophora gossypiella TaxID=13191 RepID=UPI00214F380B|nr:pseudouridylate synthase 7 homolog [Pectinophora gossypiella]